ncbi:MAG TPA: hypothetical protein VKU40_11015 [Thermoanaerobaculia bacterium]|nr:hypothetical protein [Thermoanaerobaculia bacterium]
MEAMRESWTDERLDDFRGEVNRRFDETRGEMHRRFDEVDRRFNEVDRRFDELSGQVRELSRTLNRVGGGVLVALVIALLTQL